MKPVGEFSWLLSFDDADERRANDERVEIRSRIVRGPQGAAS